MVITILSQDSPTPMLPNFVHYWTKPSCYILSRIDRVCDQQNIIQITNHTVTPPQHPKNLQEYCKRNCTPESITSVNYTRTTLGDFQFVLAVAIDISWLRTTAIRTPLLSPLSIHKMIHTDYLCTTRSRPGLKTVINQLISKSWKMNPKKSTRGPWKTFWIIPQTCPAKYLSPQCSQTRHLHIQNPFLGNPLWHCQGLTQNSVEYVTSVKKYDSQSSATINIETRYFGMGIF